MLVVIAGPTAVGKSDLAVELAEKINGEIVSADSMQIYKGFDIGTAKITQDEMKGIPHYMIDVTSKDAPFSVSDYKNMAKPIIDDILKRGKTPILVGGTGLYIDAILHPFQFGGYDETVRQKYNDMLASIGKEALYEILKKKAPDKANKIHPNNTKRVVRALETAEVGGGNSDDKVKNEYDYIYIVLKMDREALYNRVNKRVDKMIDLGLCDEVARLKDIYPWECQAMQAIGYKEWREYFLGRDTLENVKEKIKLNSRHYVKRQLTWFRAKSEAVWFDASKKDEIIEYVTNKVKGN